MDLNSIRLMRIGDLEPELRNEIQEFVSEIGYDITITDSTSLGFLVKVYENKKDRETLKKAEDMIMKLSTAQNTIRERESNRRKKEREKSGVFRIRKLGGEVTVSKKSRELLQSIGITDENVIAVAEGFLGSEKIEERVGYVKATIFGADLAKKIFGNFPELILINSDDMFISELEAMESKKVMVDEWTKTRGGMGPLWVDYNQTPGILLDSFRDIQRQLDIPFPPPVEEKEEFKYVARAMRKRDLLKVLDRLGYELVRKGKELVFKGPTSLTISDPHDGVYAPITVRKIMHDMNVRPQDFEKARREV